jgi:hypothetical protein
LLITMRKMRVQGRVMAATAIAMGLVAIGQLKALLDSLNLPGPPGRRS